MKTVVHPAGILRHQFALALVVPGLATNVVAVRRKLVACQRHLQSGFAALRVLLQGAGRMSQPRSRPALSRFQLAGRMLRNKCSIPLVLTVALAGAGKAFAQGAGNQSIIGPITGDTIPFRVYLPPSYATEPTRNYPVIYHLHGAGANYTSGTSTLETVYGGYMTNGQMPESIIVFPDGMTDSFWADSYDGTKMVETHVIQELIPHIDGTYRTMADREHRIVQGFSMGGFGAMEYASKFPTLFGAAVGLDGALTLWADLMRLHPEITSGIFNNDESYFNLYSPYSNAPLNQSTLLALNTRFFVLVGQLVQDNQNWMDTLDVLGIPYQYHDSTCQHSFSCITGNTVDMDAVAAFLNAYLTADITPPGPIGNFQSAPGDQQIQLTWSNPGDPDLTGVRIQRSTTGFPASPTSGTTVYDALGASFLDTGLINGTLYYYSAFAHDGALNYSASVGVSATPQAAQTTTATFESVAAEDGRIRETSETSGVGGAPVAGDSTTSALRVGDSAADREFRSVVSFDTSSIPDGATIVSATLKLTRGTVAGTNPFTTHGTCRVDIRTGGLNGNTALEAADFQAAATATNVVPVGMSNPTANGVQSTGAVNSTGLSAINKTGKTQFRVYFSTDDNDDGSDDYMGFYSGEATQANRPVLEVVYQ